MIKSLLQPLILFYLLIFFNVAHAGGTVFPIQITNINSISNKQHQIHFKLLEKASNDHSIYPLDNCKTATLTIEFKEWEFHHKIFLFFDNLFHPMINTIYLNQEIDKLKKYINQPILISDVEAFYYSPHKTCELLSKTIQLKYSTINLNHTPNTPILQPIRHHSRLENRPQK